MTCGECESQMSRYMDGELKDEISPVMFGHLGECSRCRALLRGFLQLQRTFRADAAQGRDERSPVRRDHSVFRRRVSVSVASAAALLVGLLLLIGGWMMFGRTSPEKEIIYVTTLPTVTVVSQTQTGSGR